MRRLPTLDLSRVPYATFAMEQWNYEVPEALDLVFLA